MGNDLTYIGAALMLVGCVFGLIGAFKGIKGKKGLNAFMLDFNSRLKPGGKRYVLTWGVMMIIGFVMVGIGITQGL